MGVGSRFRGNDVAQARVEAGRVAPRLWRLAAPTGFLPTQE